MAGEVVHIVIDRVASDAEAVFASLDPAEADRELARLRERERQDGLPDAWSRFHIDTAGLGDSQVVDALLAFTPRVVPPDGGAA